MSDHDEEVCHNYQGTEYDASADEVAMMVPENQVALNTVVYVRGHGMNLRVVTVPGSDWAMFWEEAAEFGVCQCAPPAIWYFVGVDGASVSTFTTLSVHEAVHFLRHPDHIFEEKENEPGGLYETLTLVPPDHGLDMVMAELQDHMSDMGVPDLRSDDGITYQEFKNSGENMDEILDEFFKQLGDDSND